MLFPNGPDHHGASIAVVAEYPVLPNSAHNQHPGHASHVSYNRYALYLA